MLIDKINYPKAFLENTEVLSIDEFKGNTGGEKYSCILADPKFRKGKSVTNDKKIY